MFFASLAASILSAHAGDVCSGIKFKDDAFGGGQTASEVVQGLSQFTAASVVLDFKSGKTELVISAKEFGALNGNVAAGVEVPVAFADGKTLTLATVRETPRQSYVTDSQVMTVSSYAFALDAAALDVFSANPVSVVRIPTAQGPYDWKPNGGLQKKLVAAAACFKSHAGT